MPSLHKHPRSPFWFAAFRLPDGRRTKRSTGTRNKKKALEVAMEFERASKSGNERRFTERQARKTIAAIYEIANHEKLVIYTLGEFLDDWLKGRENDTKPATFAEYRTTVERLKNHLAGRLDLHLDTVTPKEAKAFRDSIAGKLSNSTANKHLKIARVIWNEALRMNAATENPFAKVDVLKNDSQGRKALTDAHVKALLEIASGSWRGMILLGYYTGQRIGDLARITWQNVDLTKENITLITQKTGRAMNIHIHPALLRYLLTLEAPENPEEPLFADLATLRTETLSGQFAALAAEIGLREYDTKKGKRGKGRSARRNTTAFSFHSLRHSATSNLKSAGVSDSVAMELIGHDSPAISRTYTHIAPEAIRKAVNSLEDITA